MIELNGVKGLPDPREFAFLINRTRPAEHVLD
jgi:hypothetical protein